MGATKSGNLPVARLLREYLYFCTNKASKLSTGRVLRVAAEDLDAAAGHHVDLRRLLRQYLYIFTSKASKLSTCARSPSYLYSHVTVWFSNRLSTSPMPFFFFGSALQVSFFLHFFNCKPSKMSSRTWALRPY